MTEEKCKRCKHPITPMWTIDGKFSSWTHEGQECNSNSNACERKGCKCEEVVHSPLKITDEEWFSR